MKTALIYVVEDGEDTYALADFEMRAQGKKPDEIEAELKGVGKWLELSLKPATAGLERQVNALALTGDSFTGFRQDADLLPEARFVTIVHSAKHYKKLSERPDFGVAVEVSAEKFAETPINLTDRIDIILRKHLRPHAADNPDFFTRLNGSSPSSSETSPSSSS